MAHNFIPDNLLTSKDSRTFKADVYTDRSKKKSRGSSVEERRAHNPEVEGATPSPATISPNIILGYN